MNERKHLKILIGALCAVLVLLIAIVAVMFDRESPNPILGAYQTDPTVSAEEPQTPTENNGDTSQETEKTDPTDEEFRDPTEEEFRDPTEEEFRDPTEDTGEEFQETGKPDSPDKDSQDPTEDTSEESPDKEPQDSTEGTGEESLETETPDASDEELAPPEDLPPSVVIPPEEDPETGEEIGISFPCEIPEYELTIEKLAPYSGMFVEDGSNASSQDVAMLLVENNSDFPVEYTQIRVMYGQEELLFDISALPAGEKLVVQEKTGKAISEGTASSASALVVQRADMEMSESKVQVIDNGDNTLTVKNLTTETIPTVRVFYKYYMEDEELFVGGIAFTVRIARLGAGASVTIQPSHYTSQTSRVVMVLTYDSEV